MFLPIEINIKRTELNVMFYNSEDPADRLITCIHYRDPEEEKGRKKINYIVIITVEEGWSEHWTVGKYSSKWKSSPLFSSMQENLILLNLHQ